MTKTKISEFQKAVYQSLRRRADILFDMIDALTEAGQVSSQVALCEQKPFRRKVESVYDGLENGEMDIGEILSLLPGCMPEDNEVIARYKIYAVDATPNEREDAETLPDRSVLKSDKKDPLRYGQKYSWWCVWSILARPEWRPWLSSGSTARARIRSWWRCRNWTCGTSQPVMQLL